MNHQDLIIAQNLYNLFESLPQETQHLFLQRLFQEKPAELAEFTFYLDCQEANYLVSENLDFLDRYGFQLSLE